MIFFLNKIRFGNFLFCINLPAALENLQEDQKGDSQTKEMPIGFKKYLKIVYIFF